MLQAAFLLMLGAASGCSERDAGRPDGDRRGKAADERIATAKPSPEAGDGQARDRGDQGRRGMTAAWMLGRLRVAPEAGDGYDRDLFYHWAERGSCDVRDLVLARQDREGGPCGSDSGRWYSAYDGATTDDPGDFDVDHMVPLAEAWASGARRWHEDRRDAFANDLRPYSLIAVSASSNREKSDQDPAEWMPDNAGFACAYVARWIAVKFRWGLRVDRREKAFLGSALSGCRPRELRLVRIRPVG